MKPLRITNLNKTISATFVALGLAAVSVSAQTVLGSFQGATDPTDAGWIDPGSSTSITTAAADSFPSSVVPGYAQSLQITRSGYGNDLQLQFSPAQIAAFNANSYLTFTFSAPSWSVNNTTSGYLQINSIVLNAQGYGYNAQSWANVSAQGNTGANQSGMPNYYYYAGLNEQSQTVSLNYASVLPAIEAGGEGYLQLDLIGNNGGGAPNYFWINNVVLSTAPFGVEATPEPTSLALLAMGGVAGMAALRRRAK